MKKNTFIEDKSSKVSIYAEWFFVPSFTVVRGNLREYMNTDIKKKRLQKHNYRLASNFDDGTW